MKNDEVLIELLEDNFSLHDADMIYNLLSRFYVIDTKQGNIGFKGWLKERKQMEYKKIRIPIGYEDIRMFEELADGHKEPFTWTFDEIDVEFIKDDEEDR